MPFDFPWYDKHFWSWNFLSTANTLRIGNSVFGPNQCLEVSVTSRSRDQYFFPFFTIFFMASEVIDTADYEKLGPEVKFQVKIG